MAVIFITDALIFTLLALVLAFAFYARRHEYLRAPWRQVASNPRGMAAAVVLAVYVVIGLSDSLHFRPELASDAWAGEPQYATEIISVFDVVTTHLRENVEKTYSAPLATHLYAKETIDLPNGRQVRAFPRLVYGGAHLQDPASDRIGDITVKALQGAMMGLLIWGVVGAALTATLARRHSLRMVEALRPGRTGLPLRTVLATLAALLVVGASVAWVSLDYHVLGTDKVGQDVLYQALKSIRTGLVIGTLTTLVMLPFAILLGVMAGYFGGWVDDVIQYIYTTLNSIPGVLLIAAAILLLQVYMANHPDQFTSLAARADMRLLFLCMILGVTSWTGLCRLLRGEALKLREIDYVEAAHAFGVGSRSIILRHLIPNVLHIVMITVVLDFSGLVLAEAVLAYINIGVDPTMDSWGNMINSARLEMAREPIVWWSLAAAFAFMFVLVLAANLFADVVRDAFDPRLRVLN